MRADGRGPTRPEEPEMPGELVHPDDRPDLPERFRADLARPSRRRALPAPVAAGGGRRPARRPRRPPRRAATRQYPPRVAADQPARQTTGHPAREQRLGEALRGHAQQDQRDERSAMAWEDPDRPHELEPPAQGWRAWWLRDEER
jgi:hypothetical protein